jgi:hypothetical protein
LLYLRSPPHKQRADLNQAVISRLKVSASKPAVLAGSYVLFVLALALLRGPDVLLGGRFWAEEGAFWWGHVQDQGLLRHLFFVPPLAGYLLLDANLITALASLFPLVIQPHVASWVSVVLMSLPGVLLILMRPRWLPVEWVGVLSLYLALAPGVLTGEVFANSINTQTHLAICVALIAILGLSPTTALGKWIVPLLIALAGLSGWYTLALLPLFLVRSFRDGKQWIVYTAVLASAGFVQAAITLHHFLYGERWPGKASSFEPFSNYFDYFVAYLQFSVYLGSEATTHTVISGLRWMLYGPAESLGAVGFLLLVLVLLYLLIFAWVLIFKRFNSLSQTTMPRPALLSSGLALLGALLEVGLVVFGQSEGQIFGRYAVVPSVLIGLSLLLLLSAVSRLTRVRGSVVACAVTVAILGLGTLGGLARIDESFQCVYQCVPWSSQVAQARDGQRVWFQHWPAVDDSWITSAGDPKVRLAPFQVSRLESSRDESR